ncbi:hypothetical protein [Variovorax soli]|uniref:Uncharacterized protein n=1 Tax=Variovorax soli TaxID=376815 RepID=A0ABU1N8B4_9BURK|nr:hypothetical protein [Variovorax soli]
MTHISMKSTGEAVNELMAARVQAITSSSIGVIGLQSDARAKPLASTRKVRSPFLPICRPRTRAACRATSSTPESASSRRSARLGQAMLWIPKPLRPGAISSRSVSDGIS